MATCHIAPFKSNNIYNNLINFQTLDAPFMELYAKKIAKKNTGTADTINKI